VSRGLLVAVAFTLAFSAAAAPHTVEPAARAKTLAKIHGSIDALAQNGHRIAWITRQASCGKQIQILKLPGRRPVYVGSSRAAVLAALPRWRRKLDNSCSGGTIGAIALTADGRVLWQALAHSGNTELDYDVFTAALRAPRTRLVATLALGYDAGDPDDYFAEHGALPMAADGSTALLFGQQDIGGFKRIKPGIFRLVGRRLRRLANTGPGGLALSGRSFAVVTNTPRCCNYTPTWSHDGTRLAWIYHGDLWTIKADGTADRQLAAGAASPSWSSDDSRLVFEHRETNGARSIYSVNASGGGLRRLAAGSTPAWSPDGMGIAFVRGDDVYSIASDGKGERKLTKTKRSTRGLLSWSPDSMRIAVSRGGDIYSVQAGGTGEVRLTTSPRAEDQPAWSPNGAKIAFVNESSASPGIYVVNSDGSGITRLTAPTYPDVSPAWSLDSSKIAFMRDESSATKTLSVVNADGSGQRRLSSEGSSPQWAPDGGSIVVGDLVYEGGYPSNSAIRLVSPVSGKATAILRVRRSPVEIRNARTGGLVKRFAIEGYASAVALGSDYVALLVDHNPRLRVELYSLSGSFRTATAVPSRVDLISAAGRNVVFATGHAIRRLDARTGIVSTLATAGRTPVGLTIHGRRVVWAENFHGIARIRAVEAP
jgi:Tol biopolymer transport system component